MISAKLTKWALSAALAISAPVVALARPHTHVSTVSAPAAQAVSLSTSHHGLASTRHKGHSRHRHSARAHRTALHGRRHSSTRHKQSKHA